MDWNRQGADVFVRLDPGELLVASLVQIAADLPITAASITSGVGMLNGITMGFFDVARDDYQRTVLDGTYDLSVITGNIVRRDGEPAAHVHAVFNDEELRTYSGHLIEAECHITMEIFLHLNGNELQRVKSAGRPATRIVIEGQR